jgi:hypothetical protein
VFLAGGLFLYLRAIRPVTALGRYGMPVFALLMLAVQAFVFLGPPPTSPNAAAVTALGVYFLFAAVAQALATRC